MRLAKTVAVCGVFETLFYLPNHLRQTILVNSSSLCFVSKDAALLDLMNVMFKINKGVNAPIQEFRLANFFACYKPFFTSTLPYESLSLGLRLTIYEILHKQEFVSQMPGSSILSGAVAGSLS